MNTCITTASYKSQQKAKFQLYMHGNKINIGFVAPQDLHPRGADILYGWSSITALKGESLIMWISYFLSATNYSHHGSLAFYHLLYLFICPTLHPELPVWSWSSPTFANGPQSHGLLKRLVAHLAESVVSRSINRWIRVIRPNYSQVACWNVSQLLWFITLTVTRLGATLSSFLKRRYISLQNE